MMIEHFINYDLYPIKVGKKKNRNCFINNALCYEGWGQDQYSNPFGLPLIGIIIQWEYS